MRRLRTGVLRALSWVSFCEEKREKEMEGRKGERVREKGTQNREGESDMAS